MIELFARLNLWHSHVDCVQRYLRFVVYYVGGSLRRLPLRGHFTDVSKEQHPREYGGAVGWWVVVGDQSKRIQIMTHWPARGQESGPCVVQ